MNAELNAAKNAEPLESRVDELRERRPPGAVIIGGAGDSRPAEALRRLETRLGCDVVIVPAPAIIPGWRRRRFSVRRCGPRC